MRGHRGYNICPWLKNGKHKIYGKSCRDEYCKAHRFKIRNGNKNSATLFGLWHWYKESDSTMSWLWERNRKKKTQSLKYFIAALTPI